MKIISFFFLLLFFSAYSQNVGAGIGVMGIGTSGNNMAATEISADTQTGVHGSISMGTDIGL